MAGGKIAAAGGVGAAGGFSVSEMFKSLDFSAFLQDHSRQPEFIFGIVAIFCILATILSVLVRPPQDSHKHYVKYGIFVFSVVALICVGGLMREAVVNPSVRIFARFQPDLSHFRDPDKKDPVKLRLTYIEPHQVGESGSEKDFGQGPQMAEMLKGDEAIDLNYQGLDRLANRYLATMDSNHLLQRQLTIVCAHASKDVCALRNAQMEDSVSEPSNKL